MNKYYILLVLALAFAVQPLAAQWSQPMQEFHEICDLMENNGKVYALSQRAGVFRSTDNGVTWVSVNCGLRNEYMSGMAKSGNTLYAWSGYKIYYSTDEGMNWNTITEKKGAGKLAAMDNTIFITNGSDKGVLATYDRGASWVKIESGLDNDKIECLYVSGNKLYGGGKTGGVWVCSPEDEEPAWKQLNPGLTNLEVSQIVVSEGNIIINTNMGAFYSSDNGANWLPVIAPPNSDLKKFSVSGSKVICVGYKGCYLSTDCGVHWNNLPIPDSIYVPGCFCFAGDNIIVGNKYGTSYTGDGGKTWKIMNTGLARGTINAIVYNGNEFLAAGANGLLKVLDDGAAYTPLPERLPLKKINIMNSDGPAIVALGALSDDKYISKDYGLTWEHLTAANGFGATALAVSGQCIYIVSSGNKFCYSHDFGRNWKVSAGFGKMFEAGQIAAINNYVYAAVSPYYGKLVYSPDRGENWIKIDSTGKSGETPSIAVNSRGVYTIYTDSIVFTPDNGITWKKIDMPDTNIRIFSSAFRDDYVFLNTNSGLFAGSGDCRKWAYIGNGIEGPLSSMVFIGNKAYALTSNGIYHTDLSYIKNAVSVGDGGGDAVSGELSFSLAPVPASGHLTVRLPDGCDEASMVVVNTLGVVVMSGDVGNNGIVNIEGLDPGLYFFTVKAGSSVLTRKFIVER